MQWPIHQARPKCLREALTTALEVEAFYVADRHRTRVQGRAVLPSSINPPISEPENDLQKQVGELRHMVNQLLTKRDQLPWRCPGSGRLPANYSGCFTCGGLDHMQRNCQKRRPMVLGNDFQPGLRAKARLPPPVQGTTDGPLVTGSVFGVEVTFLVYTGANITILKPSVVNKIPGLERLSIERIDTSMLLTDGSSLPFQGRGRFSIRIGDQQVEHDVWAAEIELDGIIGMDFIMEHNCRLTLGQGHSELILSGNVTGCKGIDKLLKCARVDNCYTAKQ